MDDVTMLETLVRLADGIDPETGEVFPPDSPYQRPQVIRALFRAVLLLQGRPAGPGPTPVPEPSAVPSKRTPFRSKRPGEENTGQRWTPEEDARLSAAWVAGDHDVVAIARDHARSGGAIRSRLVHLGHLTAEQASAMFYSEIPSRDPDAASPDPGPA